MNPHAPRSFRPIRRAAIMAVLALAAGIGFGAGLSSQPVSAITPASSPDATAPDGALPAQSSGAPTDVASLRVYGDTSICSSCRPGEGNLPVTAGANAVVDPLTGRVPEDPPYTDPEGPFSPLSDEAPEHDYVTWNPAWISELLNDPALIEEWPGLEGPDEVSASLRSPGIRFNGQNGSEKVWLRHWYEPTRLDKDLNADDCLTDEENDGRPDAPVNPTPSNRDEWYPAIMTELTYMLLENRAPVANPDPDELDDSAPRPVCGTAGRTRLSFPVGVEQSALTDPELVGYGLTSLDYDFDGDFDLLNVSSEARVSNDLGVDLDLDGDGAIEDIDPDGVSLSCDELIVLHTDAVTLEAGDRLLLLDHVVEVQRVADSSAVLQVTYIGDLVPRALQPRSIGSGAVALAGDTGALQVLESGSGNTGVPVGPWFVNVQSVDVEDGTVTLLAGRGLGAPCASMESAPNQANLSPGGPWFLKRFYVDGHEYNIVALMTCEAGGLQYITMRAPLPKVPVTIEQHSVRLQPYDTQDALVLPPPFNHEHTRVEDVRYFGGFLDIEDLLTNQIADDRPGDLVLYMGGPMGPIPPVLSAGDGLTYEGRGPERDIGPYDDYLSTHWFYIDESVNEAMLGQLREKFGAVATDENGNPVTDALPSSFFFNEQIWTRPWNFTEFVMPDLDDAPVDPATGEPPYQIDNYLLTSGLESPTTRWRRWTMPDGEVPDTFPPAPPDLTEDVTDYVEPENLYGGIRRASILFDPDVAEKIQLDEDGTRLYGGFPLPFEDDDRICTSATSRPSIVFGAGDWTAEDPAGYPVEVPPYTDPFAPFNPQHPDAPRTDSLTFNPAYMDEFRNFGEDLRGLYAQLANNAQNARMKVYHRLWYQPDYVTKIRYVDDCDRDLTFPAMMQEFTYLFMDTTDNPIAVPVASSRIGFPMATDADQLPVPDTDGSLPDDGGEFGYGVTTYDANFDDVDEAATIHTEESLAVMMDTQWQANRPTVPGVPTIPVSGPALDFDGDGALDDLDADCTALNGNELVVMTVESLTLDMDEDSPEGHAAMFLDHLVQLENVTPGSDMQVRFHFTGGNGQDARPERINGVYTMEIGDAAVVDRFQDRVTIVKPGEINPGTDGAWFLFLEDVATDAERVTVSIGRALGATHSAIDDGFGNHDLTPGDPWYLKRFYVDAHEYNVTAIFTENGPDECNENFSFISIRTPVPKGNFFNLQDTLFQQGYFLDGLPDEMSVMPPFNVDHTIAVDLERLPESDFAYMDRFDACVGELAAAPALVERIREETREWRLGNELRETYNQAETDSGGPMLPDDRFREGWETHQVVVTPWDYTDVQVPEGQIYLLTMDWRSDVSRLAFYGCTRDEPGPFAPGPDRDPFGNLVPNPPPLSHNDIASAAATWSIDPPHHIGGVVLPLANQTQPPQPFEPNDIVPYFDGFCPGGERVRAKLFYDPADTDDIYVNDRQVRLPTRFADLSIDKRASSSAASAGDDVLYTLTVTNNGPDDVEDATVVDTLPIGVDYIGDTDDCTEGPEGTLTCQVGMLAAGNARAFALQVRLDENLSSGDELENLARVTASGAIDTDPTNNRDTATVVVRNRADLAVSKEASDLSPRAGEQLVYILTVVNGGPADAMNVVLEDTLPAGVTYIGDNGGCDASGLPVLRCEIGDLANGASAQVAVTVEVDEGLMPGRTLVNRVDASSDDVDPEPGNDSDEVAIIVTAEAELEITKRATVDDVVAGGLVRYTVGVTNTGPSGVGTVEVIDELPDEVTYVSDTDACTESPVGTLTCEVGPLPAGGSVFFDIFVAVDPDLEPGTELVNRVRVDASGVDDPNPSNNRDTETVVVTRSADVRIVKRAPRFALVTEDLIYRLTVFNDGPSSANNVIITDTLPADVAFVGSTDDLCALTPPRAVVCAIGMLAPGESRGIAIRVNPDDDLLLGARLINRAAVDADEPDPDPSNNDDETTTRMVTMRQADLSVTKSGPGTVRPGGSLTYSIMVTNDGPSPASSVVLTDTVPADTNFVGAAGASCAETAPGSGVVVCDLGALAPGGARGILLTVAVDPDAQVGSTLTNGVEVDSELPDPDIGNDLDTADTLVVDDGGDEMADLGIAKSGPGTVNAGSLITWTIEVENDGPDDAQDVVVTDALPDGVTYLSDTTGGGCQVNGNLLLCELGTLADGASVTFEITGGVASDLEDGAELLNASAVGSSTTDPDGANNQDDALTQVEVVQQPDEADLQVIKTVNTGSVIAGLPISYTIRVTNLGPAFAPRVLLTDTLPVDVSFTATSIPCEETVPGGREVTCDLGPMFVDQTLEFTLDALVDSSVQSGTNLVNVVNVGFGVPDEPVQALGSLTIAADSPWDRDAATPAADPDDGNNRSEAAAAVRRLANLGVHKRASSVTPSVGDRMDWIVSVRNAGPSDAEGVRLSDDLADGLGYVSDTAGCGQDNLRAGCELGALPAGASRLITLTTQIDQRVAVGTALRDPARVEGTDPDPDPSDNEAEGSAVVAPPRTIAPRGLTCRTTPTGLALSWADGTPFETAHIVELALAGQDWTRVARLGSPDPEGTGAPQSWTSGALAMDTSYDVRVGAEDDDGGLTWSTVIECRTAVMPPAERACYDGTIDLQGRTAHDGVQILADGMPVAVTGSSGDYGFCMAPAAQRMLETARACYLPASGDHPASAGDRVDLPATSLPGGDTDGDGLVNLFDLVRVGANYRLDPPNDMRADCTGDGYVNLFDLVLVGANYGGEGPVAFGHQGPVTPSGGTQQPQAEGTIAEVPGGLMAGRLSEWLGTDPAMDVDAAGGSDAAVRLGVIPALPPEVRDAPLGSPRVLVTPRRLADGRLALDVTAAGIQDLWGAELALHVDPALWSDDGQDALTMLPGGAWRDGGFVAQMEADREAGLVRFGGTRLAPAPPVDGIVPLLTIAIELPSALDDWSTQALADAGGWSLEELTLLDHSLQTVEIMR